MEVKELERIERFLSGRMLPEESRQFEAELRTSKELAEQTKKMAYIIHSVNVVGLKRDNERIRRIYASISSDYKRFVVSVAAMLAVVLVFATVVSVPVYRHVVKPIIEKVFHSSSAPKQVPDEVPIDTMLVLPIDSLGVDTLSVDTIDASVAQKSVPIVPVVKKKIENKVEKVENKVMEVKKDTILPIKVDTVPSVVIQKVVSQEPPKPANRIVSYNQLKNYQFGGVTARREGKNVICSFTMWNDVEDAKIQMHSARAKDGNGKNYLAKYCLLNGQNKRIIEKWKKNEKHLVEVTIVDVPNDILDFESISFSFQSEGDSLKQKSQSIILKVGEIK